MLPEEDAAAAVDFIKSCPLGEDVVPVVQEERREEPREQEWPAELTAWGYEPYTGTAVLRCTKGFKEEMDRRWREEPKLRERIERAVDWLKEAWPNFDRLPGNKDIQVLYAILTGKES